MKTNQKSLEINTPLVYNKIETKQSTQSLKDLNSFIEGVKNLRLSPSSFNEEGAKQFLKEKSKALEQLILNDEIPGEKSEKEKEEKVSSSKKKRHKSHHKKHEKIENKKHNNIRNFNSEKMIRLPTFGSGN